MEPKQKKILLLTTAFGKGGAEKQLFLLAKHLQQKGYNIAIASVIKRNMYEKELEEAEIPFQSLDFSAQNGVVKFLQYIKYVRTYKPDLIISFMFSASMLSRVAKLFCKFKEITSIRNEIFGGKYSNQLLRSTNFLSDLIVVNSRSVMQRLVAKEVIPLQKSYCVANVVEISEHNLANKTDIRQQVRKELNIPDDKFVFLFVANYRPQKDYDNLLRAIATIKGDCVLIMTGNLYEKTWPAERIKELDVENKVRLLGKRDDMWRFYLTADSLVLSSKWEGLPNVILEAMSYQLPVVSTNVGGVEDLVEDGKNGMLCMPEDHLKLAGCMERMMAVPEEKRAEMGIMSKTIMNKDFTYNAIMSQWDSLINPLIHKEN